MILIKNGRVIDPANSIDERRDILIRGGVIAESAPYVSVGGYEGGRVIDASGCWVVPGLIDLHTHLREPGFEHKETIATGSAAAAAGGFTTICCMPNTDPVVDNEVVAAYIKMKAEREGVVNVLPIGSLTKGQKGETLADIGKMAGVGICAVSEDGRSVRDARLMKTALRYAAQFGLPVFSHCEDETLSGGYMNEGARSALMGVAGISNDSEEVIVARDIILAGAVNARLHICHVSAAGSVALIRSAKARLQNVTCEATPHHFTLADSDISDYDANFKMNPPLRSVKDRAAVLDGLRDGSIDAIATDHAPHHYDEKNVEFERAANGIIGLETALALAFTELVEKNIVTPLGLVEKMSLNPARILGIDKGTLSKGAAADVTVIDTSSEYAIDISKFKSKSRNSPFDGRRVKGRVQYTIVGGRIVVDGGELVRDWRGV